MRIPIGVFLTVLSILTATAARAADDDEAKAKLEAQKKAAMTNWASLEAGEAAPLHETPHVLLVGAKSYEKRLKEIGTLLDRAFEKACSALKIDTKEAPPWPGKLTVYLVTEREHFTAFVRRIEKRRLEAGEVGSYAVDRDEPHVVGSPPRSKVDPPAEIQAVQQVAAAVLHKKAGAKTPLPGWLLQGFGRATYYHIAPASDASVRTERTKAAELVTKAKKTANEVISDTLDVEEHVPLSASLVDFLAYGPGAMRFPQLVEGYKPEENQESRTTAQALESARMSADLLDKNWRAWVPRAR